MRFGISAGRLSPEALRPHFRKSLDPAEIYLANHSLGRPPDCIEDDVLEGLRLWPQKLDAAWDPWMDEARAFTARIKQLANWKGHLVPKTSCGQALRAILNAWESNGPIRVVAGALEFDSVDFILRAYEAKGRVQVTWVQPEPGEVPLYGPESYLQAIESSKPDLVVVSQVVFMTGQVMPQLESIVSASHALGARVFLDTYHALGVLDSYSTCGADFIAGGSYKYLRGGPGACFLGVCEDFVDDPIDTGWFAKANTFGYERKSRLNYAEGDRRWWESTPAVLPFFQSRAGAEFVLECGVDRLREHNLAQQDLLRHLVPRIYQPEDPRSFGAFSLLVHPDAKGLTTVLKANGINVDSRQNFVRICPDALTTDVEIHAAAVKINQLIDVQVLA